MQNKKSAKPTKKNATPTAMATAKSVTETTLAEHGTGPYVDSRAIWSTRSSNSSVLMAASGNDPREANRRTTTGTTDDHDDASLPVDAIESIQWTCQDPYLFFAGGSNAQANR
jgi:hypothetical protein